MVKPRLKIVIIKLPNSSPVVFFPLWTKIGPCIHFVSIIQTEVPNIEERCAQDRQAHICVLSKPGK